MTNEDIMANTIKLDKKIGEMLKRMDRSAQERIIKLFISGIITKSEARIALDLPSLNDEIQLDSAKFQTLKHARNRYDYLCRKMSENKSFSERDYEDYEELSRIFRNSDV